MRKGDPRIPESAAKLPGSSHTGFVMVSLDGHQPIWSHNFRAHFGTKESRHLLSSSLLLPTCNRMTASCFQPPPNSSSPRRRDLKPNKPHHEIKPYQSTAATLAMIGTHPNRLRRHIPPQPLHRSDARQTPRPRPYHHHHHRLLPPESKSKTKSKRTRLPPPPPPSANIAHPHSRS
ncbi:hypothetical protein VTK56DRAFT_3961 [Thermocarpiscus australiensis]